MVKVSSPRAAEMNADNIVKSQLSPGTVRTIGTSTHTNREGRVIKHRSSQACQSCRVRKVRCDIVANRICCTNCRLDGVECVVIPSRRGKGGNNHRRDSAPKSRSDQRRSSILTDGSSSIQAGSVLSPDQKADSSFIGRSGQVPTCVTFDQDVDSTTGGLNTTDDNVISIDTGRGPNQAYDGLLTPDTAGTNIGPQYQSPVAKTLLPDFIKPLSNRILDEDLDFLNQKGALNFPAPDLQSEILQGYLFSVHPFMPMLNFRSFIHAHMGTQEHGRISLLLFQAVMFAGLHGLPQDVIHRLGFSTTKQAREVFFNRVRLLYDFNVEPDDAAVLQSLLLMSSWYSKWDDRRHTWHWTGLAYDLARSMGLHREPTTRYASNNTRRFRRRLWWSLYIRDRLIALGTRRPMRISDDDFDVSMLTLEDFDLDPTDEFNEAYPLVPDVKENTSTALMCIQLARLGIRIGHVMISQYTTLSDQCDVPHTMLVVSRRDESRVADSERCEAQLNEWFGALSANLRRSEATSRHASSQSCSEVHWAMLNLTYLTTVNVLHRALALQPRSDSTEAHTAQRSSRAKIKDTARRLTKLSQNMLRQDQVRFLSVLGVTALVAAGLSHMLDISSGDEDVRDASTFRLHQNVQVLKAMGAVYASADAAVSFLSSVTRTVGINVTPEVTSTNADAVAISTSSSNNRPGATLKTGDLLHRGTKTTMTSGTGAMQSNGQLRDSPLTSPSEQLLRGNEGFLNTNSMANPAIDLKDQDVIGFPFAISNSATVSRQRLSSGDTQALEQTVLPLPSVVNGGSSNLNDDGTLFNWNNGLDAGLVEDGTAFNYDFYSDAFGFGLLDGQLQSA